MAAPRIPAIETLSEESQALYDVVNNEGDFPCVLITTSFLDQCLASMLERFFIQGDTAKSMLGLKGPLGSFSARADLTYCLGLIPKGLFQNLGIVGEIRNRFAHSYLGLSFADPAVTKLCEMLTFPKFAGGKSYNGITGEVSEIDDPWPQLAIPRPRFTVCVVLMANRLMVTGLAIERRPVREKGWN